MSLLFTVLALTASADPMVADTDGLMISATWNSITDAETGLWWSTDASGAITVGDGSESWPWESEAARPVMQRLVDRLEQVDYGTGYTGGVEAPQIGILIDPEGGEKAIFALATEGSSGWPWGSQAASPAWLGEAPEVAVYTLQTTATTADAR